MGWPWSTIASRAKNEAARLKLRAFTAWLQPRMAAASGGSPGLTCPRGISGPVAVAAPVALPAAVGLVVPAQAAAAGRRASVSDAGGGHAPHTAVAASARSWSWAER